MEKLIELVTIVNRIKSQRIEVIGKGRGKKGQKLKTLYDGIAQGKITNDQEAAAFIYGEEYCMTNYTTLKNSLTNHLLNSLFFINLAEYKFNDYQKNYINAQKLRAVIQILISRASRKVSIELAEKLIRKSLKYQFTEINLELSKLLRRHYRAFDYKAAKAKKYDAIVKEQLAILNAETIIEDYYEQLIQGLGNKRSSRLGLVAKGKDYADKTRLIFPKVVSNKLGQYAHLIFILEHELANNYELVETSCKTAIQYHEKKKHFNSVEKLLGFYIKLLAAYIPLQKFQAGEAIAQKIIKAIMPSSLNWFLTLDHYFLLSMHTGNYERAQSILQQASSNKNLKKLDTQYKEIWLIYEAYIEYLKEAGILEKESKKNFRVARFMNEVPNFSKDKTGINISILIIQILLLIAQGKEMKVIDKMEALRTYIYTHLRKGESLRSNVFIKMLLKMVESKFHKAGTIRRTKTLRKKLSDSPIGTKGYSQYVEIIPYEKLWEMSLKFLNNRAF